ncbi:hypothetical protein Mapa_001852 [Marchantia paleacea]|nr:hypothetical protein Mapa_001852 [Marchantia paleacea]
MRGFGRRMVSAHVEQSRRAVVVDPHRAEALFETSAGIVGARRGLGHGGIDVQTDVRNIGVPIVVVLVRIEFHGQERRPLFRIPALLENSQSAPWIARVIVMVRYEESQTIASFIGRVGYERETGSERSGGRCEIVYHSSGAVVEGDALSEKQRLLRPRDEGQLPGRPGGGGRAQAEDVGVAPELVGILIQGEGEGFAAQKNGLHGQKYS